MSHSSSSEISEQALLSELDSEQSIVNNGRQKRKRGDYPDHDLDASIVLDYADISLLMKTARSSHEGLLTALTNERNPEGKKS